MFTEVADQAEHTSDAGGAPAPGARRRMLEALAACDSATVQELTALLAESDRPRGWRTVQGMLGASAARGWARRLSIQTRGSNRWEITEAGREWLADSSA